MHTLENLVEKMESRSAVIGVVGMGYVGQPLALQFSKVGFEVIGFDIDAQKVRGLNEGVSSIEISIILNLLRPCRVG